MQHNDTRDEKQPLQRMILYDQSDLIRNISSYLEQLKFKNKQQLEILNLLQSRILNQLQVSIIDQYQKFDNKIFIVLSNFLHMKVEYHKFVQDKPNHSSKDALLGFGRGKKNISYRQNSEIRIKDSKQQEDIKRQEIILESILARVKKIQQREYVIQQKYDFKNHLFSTLPYDSNINKYQNKKSTYESNFNKEITLNHLNQPNITQNFFQKSKPNKDPVQQISKSSKNKTKMQSLVTLQNNNFYAYQTNQISELRNEYRKINKYNTSSVSQLSKDIKKLIQIQQRKLKQVKTPILMRKNNNQSTKKLFRRDQNSEQSHYQEFITLINWSNNIFHKEQNDDNSYKFFIEKGNNHQLVKSIIKKRYWWNLAESSDDHNINLYWTQNRNLKFLLNLPKINESKNDCLAIGNVKQTKVEIRNLVKKNLLSKKLLSKFDIEQIEKNNYNQKRKEETYYDNPISLKMHNHLEFNWNLSNKKMLYKNLKRFYLSNNINPFQNIPVTFHVKEQGDDEWNQFIKCFHEKQKIKNQISNNLTRKREKNIWIIKPGQNTNRGFGIQISDSLVDIKKFMDKNIKNNTDKLRTYIIQEYLMPFLYYKRKFDIRSYILITSIHNKLKAYWYEEGYIRTSSKQFSLHHLQNKYIHLTNDAIQNKGEDYGKFEPGNKISFNQFEKYLNVNFLKKYNFREQILPSMIKLATDAIKATYNTLDLNNRQFTFQIFGLDFLIDQNFKVWLIQINTNPCLELSCPLLTQIIPNMIQNSLKIAIDPIFPPPNQLRKLKSPIKNIFERNKYELIFDSEEEVQTLRLDNKTYQVPTKYLS